MNDRMNGRVDGWKDAGNGNIKKIKSSSLLTFCATIVKL